MNSSTWPSRLNVIERLGGSSNDFPQLAEAPINSPVCVALALV